MTYIIQGSTSPGQNGNLTVTPPSGRYVERGLGSIISGILHGRSGSGGRVCGLYQYSFTLGFNVTVDKQQTLPFDEKKNLFNDTLKCPLGSSGADFTGTVSVDVEAKGSIAVDYGFAAVGSVIPPHLDDFGLFAQFSGSLDGILSADVNLQVQKASYA